MRSAQLSSGAVIGLISGALLAGSQARATIVTYTIDPQASELWVTGASNGASLQARPASSFLSSYTGTITAEVTGDSVEVLSIVLKADRSGPGQQRPLIKRGWSSLDLLELNSGATGKGSLATIDGMERATIPIDTALTLTIDKNSHAWPDGISFSLSGELVGARPLPTVHSPEPAMGGLLLAGAAAALIARRRRCR